MSETPFLASVRQWLAGGGRADAGRGRRHERRRLAVLLRRCKKLSLVSRISSLRVSSSSFSLHRSSFRSQHSVLGTQHFFFEALESRLLLSGAPSVPLMEATVLDAGGPVQGETSQASPTSDSSVVLSVEDAPLEPLATTFFVTNTTNDGPGSLRQAILDANAASGSDTISFAIPGADIQSIALLSALPTITDPVVIDGTTQPGYAGTPLIELNGTGAGADVNGLRVTANNTTIRGLIINRFSGNGIRLENSTGATIDRDFIGTDAAGTVPQGNGNDGISLLNSSNSKIGGYAPGLVSLWSADGTARDSVGSNNGTLFDGSMSVTLPDSTRFLPAPPTGSSDEGKFGPAFTFDGINDSMQVPDADSLSPHASANGEMTIAAWVKVAQLPTGVRAPIVAKGAPSNWEYALYVNPDNPATEISESTLSFVVWQSGGADYALATGGRLTVDNQWHHVAGVLKKGQVAQLYVDGQFAEQDTSFAGSTANGTAKLFFGTRGDSQKFLNGSVDEVALFNRVLSPTEIQSLARRPAEIGGGNRIAFNAGDGVGISVDIGQSATGNLIQGNQIFANGQIGIDLDDNQVTANDPGDGDTGPNRLQNFPVITSADVDEGSGTVFVSGSLNSSPNTSFRLEFFAGPTADTSGFGEGQTFLGSTIVTTDAGGNASYTKNFTSSGLLGQAVTATATNLSTNDTSEFSQTVGIPILALDPDGSSGAVGLEFATSWTFGLGPVPIADTDTTVSDPDSATLQSITITLTNRPNGNSSESLAATTTGTPIAASYNSSTGVLSLTGTATLAQYQQVLRTVTYNNTAATPNSAQRVITLVANDGANVSAPATVRLEIGTILTVTNTNDAGAGSLRQAIVTANTNGPGKDRIMFNIAGAGVKTIAPLSPLPTITTPVSIDGTTQPGYVPGTPVVTLDGIGAGVVASGLTISGRNTTVTGLTITRFGNGGLILQSGPNVVDNSVISSNPSSGIFMATSSSNPLNNLIGQRSPGLVGYWSGDGTANDSLGLNNGTLFNGVTFVPGRFGQAFSLDGVDDFVQVADSDWLSPQTGADGAMTVSAWVNLAELPPAGGQNRRVIVAKGGPDNYEYALYAYSDGSVGFEAWNPVGARYALAQGGMITAGQLNQWHHVAGTLVKGEKARVFLDGLQVGEGSPVPERDSTNVASPLFIGKRGDGQNLKALIDEVALFNRALSADEIQAFAFGSRVGVGNQISTNTFNGVVIASGIGNLIQGNRIFGNGLIGIELGDTGVTPNDAGDGDFGPNRLQNFPVLTSAFVSGGGVTIAGSLNSRPDTAYRLEFFANPSADTSGFGEGQTAIGTMEVTTDANGNVTFRRVFSTPGPIGQFLSATATNLSTNDTSEFSQAIPAVAGTPVIDLDGGQPGSDFATSWTQGLGPVRIADADAMVTDPDTTTLQSMTIALTNRPNGIAEVLDATVAGTGITENYNSSTGVYTLTGTASVALYQQVLRTATYNNTAATPNSAQRVITVVANDGANVSAPATVRLEIGRLFTVNSTGDQSDLTPGDGIADVDPGPGVVTTLRAAIQEANTGPGKDRIAFNISGAGVQTIALTSALPTITSQVIIDGTTQPGFSGTPLIELNGANAGSAANGLFITAGNSLIRGLIINRFNSTSAVNGVLIQTGGGNVIEGNYIGTNAAGTAASANQDGIEILNSSNNTIGGTSDAARNVISGNTMMGVRLAGTSSDNQVIGNFIGTNAAGTGAVGNGDNGVYILDPAHDNVIGGPTAAHRNIISGNQDGIHLESGTGTSLLNNLIQGNYIGTDVTGTVDLGNSQKGVRIAGVSGTIIETGNVISGNDQEGVLITGAASNANVIRGNRIGTKADGQTGLGNTNAGIAVSVSNANTTEGLALYAGNVIGGTAPGDGNIIAFNGGPGVSITRGAGLPTSDPAGTRYAILGNAIFSNGGLGIDLGANGVTPNDATDSDVGANNLQNFPVLTRAVISGSTITIAGTLSSETRFSFEPLKSYLIEFFANPAGGVADIYEGQRFLGRRAVTTGEDGTATFSATFEAQVSVGERITATATEVESAILEDDAEERTFLRTVGNTTSEFSVGIPVPTTTTPAPTFRLEVTTNGSGDGRVVSSPGGIDFNSQEDANNPDRNDFQDYAEGTLVTLTATPDPGFLFGGWRGYGITESSPTLTVNVTEARTYTATFTSTRSNGSPEAIRPALQYVEAVSFWPGTVTLTWLPVEPQLPTGPNGFGLSSYNVFVGDASGQYGLIQVPPITSTELSPPGISPAHHNSSITLTNLPSIPLFFAVTLSLGGLEGTQESGFSDEVSATPIPGLEAFQFVDEGTANGPSEWTGEQKPVTGQYSAIGTPNDNTAAQRGTLLYLTNGFPQGRSDYELTMTLRSQADGALGTTFRYVDPNNFYRFSMDRDPDQNPNTNDGYYRLIQMKDGVPIILDEKLVDGVNVEAYRPRELYLVTLTANQSVLDVRVVDSNGLAVATLATTNPDFAGNGYSLYSARNPGSFYDLVAVQFGDPDPALNLVGLQVNTTGTGRGIIRSAVNGQTASLAFPGSPAATFSRDTVVTLTATPTAGSRFAGWYLGEQLQTLDANLTVTASDSTAYEARFAPNAAPTGQNKTIPIIEDTPYVFTVLDFGFADTDAGDLISAVRIDSLSLGGGTLRLNGTDVVTGQLIGAANIANLIFTPELNANGNGIASFTFSVRDSALTFDPSPNTITFNVTPVNDAPVLDASKSPVLTAVDEDALAPVGPVGTLVSALVDLAVPAGGLDNVTDVDAGAVTGIAVTAADSTNADWFFSINDGGTWTALGVVSTGSARLLAADANTRLYAQPKPENFNGTIDAALTFRAWDQSTGTNGGTADTTANGGTTAFSTATDTAALTITPVNDAPVLGVIGPQAVVEGQLLSFTATAGDVDTPLASLQFSLEAGAPVGASIDASTGVFTWTPTDAQGPGTYEVRIIVSDSALSADQLVPITVRSSVTLDIDGDGIANATDGTLMLRYLARMPDSQLVAGPTVAGTSTPMDGATIRLRLDDIMTREPLMLDADGDGQLNPFTDGRLIFRFLSDQANGPSLTGAVVGANASRATSEEIRTFLTMFLPLPLSQPSSTSASFVTSHLSLVAESAAASAEPSAPSPEPSAVSSQLSATSGPSPSSDPSITDHGSPITIPMGFASLTVQMADLTDDTDATPLMTDARPWLSDFVGSSAVADDPNRDLLVAL